MKGFQRIINDNRKTMINVKVNRILVQIKKSVTVDGYCFQFSYLVKFEVMTGIGIEFSRLLMRLDFFIPDSF